MIIYCLQDRQNDYKRAPYNNTGSKNPVLGSSGTSRYKKKVTYLLIMIQLKKQYSITHLNYENNIL
jgi:hypothetical protein